MRTAPSACTRVSSVSRAPDHVELQFWRGITFAEQGRESEARAVLVEVYRRDQNWAELLRRLPMIEPALAGAEVIARLSALPS